MGGVVGTDEHHRDDLAFQQAIPTAASRPRLAAPSSTNSTIRTPWGVDHPEVIVCASATYAQRNASDLTPVSIQPRAPHLATCQPAVSPVGVTVCPPRPERRR